MKTKADFVSPADFKNYWGIDLDLELRDQGTELDSSKSMMFLIQVEDRLESWIDSNTFRNYTWDELSGDDREAMQKAVLAQAMYVFKNGNLSLDSGYDPQRGSVIAKKDLQNIEVCSEAVDILKAAGLYSRSIINHRRYDRRYLK